MCWTSAVKWILNIQREEEVRGKILNMVPFLIIAIEGFLYFNSIAWSGKSFGKSEVVELSCFIANEGCAHLGKVVGSSSLDSCL